MFRSFQPIQIQLSYFNPFTSLRQLRWTEELLTCRFDLRFAVCLRVGGDPNLLEVYCAFTLSSALIVGRNRAEILETAK